MCMWRIAERVLPGRMVRELIENDRIIGGITEACAEHAEAVYRVFLLPEWLQVDIAFTPEHLSASFHGRDLFAPVAAMLARGDAPPGRPRNDDSDRRADWPDDLGEIVYVDHYGNAMTGLRGRRNAAFANFDFEKGRAELKGQVVLADSNRRLRSLPADSWWALNLDGE